MVQEDVIWEPSELLPPYTGPEYPVASGSQIPLKIPADKEPPKGDYEKRMREFYRRVYNEGSKKHIPEDVPYRKEAFRILDQYQANDYDALPMEEQPSYSARKLIDKMGATDPVLLFITGVGMPNGLTSIEYIKKSYEQIRNADYPAILKLAILTSLSDMIIEHKNLKKNLNDEVREYDKASLELLKQSLEDTSFEDGEYDLIVYRLDYSKNMHSFFTRNRKSVVEIICKSPRISPAIKEYLVGSAYVQIAWKHRGSGWANTVSEEGWKGFYENLDKARLHLKRSWILDPNLYFAQHAMFDVLKGAGPEEGETARLWFDRGVASQWMNTSIYVCYLDTLRPRWGGSYEEMFALGVEAMDTGRYDSLVPEFLLMAVSQIENDEKSTEIYQSQVVVDKLMEMLGKYLENPSRPKSPDYYKTQMVMVGAKAKRYAAIGELYDRYPGKIVPSILSKKELDWYDIRRSIAIESEVSLQITAAEDTLRNKNPDKTLEVLGKIPKEAKLNSIVREYIARLHHSAELQKGINSGNWTSIDPGKNMEGWIVKSGDFRSDGNGSLVLFSNSSYYEAALDVQPAVGFEFTGKFIFDPHFSDQQIFSVYMLFSFENYEATEFFEVRKSNDGTAMIIGRNAKMNIPIQDNMGMFNFVLKDGLGSLMVNNKVIFEKITSIDPKDKKPNKVSISIRGENPGQYQLKFQDLKLRNLTQ